MGRKKDLRRVDGRLVRFRVRHNTGVMARVR